MLQVVGFVGALLVGFVLGLLGGGGAILTVPLLTYLFQVPAEKATSYSLFVVAVTSFVGCLSHFLKRNVETRVAVVFLVPALIGVSISRSLLIPGIPGHFPKHKIILLTFAVVMIWAAVSMLRKKKEGAAKPTDLKWVGLLGGLSGVVMGFVGAGGGFLIVPVLVNFGGVGMHRAVGTSLVVITVSTFVGFLNDVVRGVEYDWKLLLLFTGIALGGVFIGARLSTRVSAPTLKKYFGYLILLVAGIVFYKELLA